MYTLRSLNEATDRYASMWWLTRKINIAHSGASTMCTCIFNWPCQIKAPIYKVNYQISKIIIRYL